MRVFFIIIALLAIIIIYRTIRKGDISLNDSFFWMSASVVILILGIFPKSLDKLAAWLGIGYYPSLLFLMAIMFLLYINFRLVRQIHKLNIKVMELSQQLSIYRLDNKGKK